MRTSRTVIALLSCLVFSLPEVVAAADGDGDGMDDDFEVTHGFDPLDPDEDDNGRVDGQDDADADGLGNAAEHPIGTDPNDSDSDDDGLLDGDEVGTGSFSENVIISGTDEPKSVVAADLDGDGDVDVVTASYNDDKIAWFENTNGLGEFAPQRVITVLADGAHSVTTADVDGDGDVDVVSASYEDDKIAWYENTDGLGAFGPQRVITTLADGARSVFAADLDGDGDTDVLSASRYDDKIAWYENTNGLGSFGPQQTITTLADRAWSVFAIDLDGDEDLDVISASYNDDKIAWYENTDGLGAFGPQQIITNVTDGPRSVFGADVDGDGDADVLEASYLHDRIAWYENTDGLGSFGPQQLITYGAASGARSVVGADVDGDGDIDVLTASENDHEISWYENTDGLGNFGPQQAFTTTALGATSVFAADVDGDGDVDALSTAGFDDKVAWYANTDGLGSFGPGQVFTGLANGPRSALAADVDGDGAPDVVAATTGDSQITWYRNTDGSGDFGSQQLLASAAGVYSLASGDVDGDGDLDLFMASDNDDEVAWYENTDGLGGFGPRQVITALADGARSVFVADVDGDGDADALSASFFDDKVEWYENTDGLGTFGPPQLVATAVDGASSVFAADLDGDGDKDVLAAAREGDRVEWYENSDGLGTFGPVQVVTVLSLGAVAVFGADIDGDGDSDVVSGSKSDDKISWYENTDGLGSFGPRQVITSLADGARSVFAVDVDADGDTDVLSASFSDDKIAWYENVDGLGGFGPQRVITPLADGAESVFAADVDGDGDTDVVWASRADDTIAWHEQLNVADPLDADTDGDGLCDGGPPGTAAECADGGEDTNGNGVYDVGVETDPSDPDTDDDGFSDGAEVAAGTDPLDGMSFPNAAVPLLSPLGLAVLGLLLGGLGIRASRQGPIT